MVKALPGNVVITSQVIGNPKKQRSFDAYAKYGFNGMRGATITLAAYVKNLGSATVAYGHVAWDVNHGFITVQGLNGWPIETPALPTQTPVAPAVKDEPPKPEIDPFAKEAVDYFFKEVDLYDEIKRMAATAMQTAAYSNGQLIVAEVKSKDTNFVDRYEMEVEIEKLLRINDYRCALTGYDFRRFSNNPHLKPSLDRKDSGLGYIKGNIQVVTRAANFYKSASDEADWKLKAKAMRQMALAMQQRRGAQTPRKV